jgi:WD40 repeat protein
MDDFLKFQYLSSDNEIYRIEINHEKQLLFVGDIAGTFRLFKWRIESNYFINFEIYMEKKNFHSNYIWYSTFSLDGKYLYTGDNDGKIVKWDVENSTEIHVFNVHVDTRCLMIYKNYFISTSRDELLIFWDLESNEKKHSFTLAVYIKLFLNEDELVILTADGKVMIMDLNNFEIIFTMAISTSALWSFLVLENGDYLVGDNDGCLHLFNRNTKKNLPISNIKSGRISHLMYFRGEIVSVSISRRLTFHDPISLTELRYYDTDSNTSTMVNLFDKIFLTAGMGSEKMKIWFLWESTKMIKMLKKKKILDISFDFVE